MTTQLGICISSPVFNWISLASVLPTFSSCPTYAASRSRLGQAQKPLQLILIILIRNDLSHVRRDCQKYNPIFTLSSKAQTLLQASGSEPSSLFPVSLSGIGPRWLDFLATMGQHRNSLA